MKPNEYQEETNKTANYYFKHDVMMLRLILALGLTGESGEVADKIKKYYRVEHNPVETHEKLKQEVAKELGDVLWYVARLSDAMGYTLEEVMEMNIQKLRDRQDRNVIHGEGDNR